MKFRRNAVRAGVLALGAAAAFPAAAALVAPCTGTTPGVEGTICTLCDLFATGQNIFNFMINIAAALMGIGVLYGGILLMIAGGNEDLHRKGIDAVRRAVIGFVIVFGAWVIINTILVALGGSAQPRGFPWPWNEVRCR